MTSSAKDQGTQFETEVAVYLQGWGFPARRTVQTQALDMGDIEGVPDFTLQCKSGARVDYPKVMAETLSQAERAQTRYGAIVKANGRGVKNALVVMPMETFARLVWLIESYREYRDTGDTE